MKDKINQELVKLQNELEQLDAAVKHIAKAEKISTDVISATQTIHSKYKTHLNEVLKQYENYLKKSYDQTDTQLRELFASHQKQVGEVSKILGDYVNLAQLTSKLADKVENADFKVDTEGIEQSVAFLKTDIEEVYRQLSLFESSLKDDANTNTVDILNKLSEQEKRMDNLQKAVSENMNQVMAQSDTVIKTVKAMNEASVKRYNTIVTKQKLIDKRVKSTRRWVIFTIIISILIAAGLVLGFLYFHDYTITIDNILETAN